MVEAWQNIKYSNPERCLLDVYKDRQQPIGPTIICAHGGSWMLSNKTTASDMSTVLAENGCCVIAPSYRLSTFSNENIQTLLFFESVLLLVLALLTDGHERVILVILMVFLSLVILTYVISKPRKIIRHPTHVKDLATVLKWTYLNCKRFGGDPNLIFVLGHSAGGHLVTLLSNNPLYIRQLNLPENIIKGTISLSGVFSDKRMKQTRIGKEILEMVFGKHDNYYDAFPIYNCHNTSPPHLLINADVDYSLKRHTHDLFFALQEQGVYVKTFVAASQSHFSVRKEWRTGNKETLKEILEFIDQIIDYQNISCGGRVSRSSGPAVTFENPKVQKPCQKHLSAQTQNNIP
jgi:acetyl esterase/lipase